MILYRSWSKQFNHFIYFKNGRYFIQRLVEKYQEQCLVCVEHYFSWDNAEQYTRLKDKNGVEIYEGDLIELCENKNGCLEVVFVNAYVGGWVLKYEGKSELSLGAREQNDLKVIGHIHQDTTVESDKENIV